MKNGKFQFGIIGAGVIGPTHAKAIRDLSGRAEVTAVADIEESRAADLAKKFGATAVYKDYRELLKNKDIDVVNVCVPSGLHGQVVKDAAKAGKHIVCEKPIEITLPKIDEMVKACKDANIKLACIFQRRMAPTSVELKKKIDSGAFGKMVMGSAYLKYYRSAEYYKSAGWRATWELDGGGALMNQAVHGVDLLQYYMGEPVSVNAYCETLSHDIKVEDTAVAVLRFKSGALGVIEGTTNVYPGSARKIEIQGTKGTAVLEDYNTLIKYEFEGQGDTSAKYNEAKVKGGSADPTAMSRETHAKQFAAYIEALMAGKEPPIGAQEARKSVEIILAIYKSAKEKREVRLPL